MKCPVYLIGAFAVLHARDLRKAWSLRSTSEGGLKPFLYASQGKTLIFAAMDRSTNYDKSSPKDGNQAVVRAANDTGIAVSIRALGPNHRERLRKHLLALETADRFLRFGYVATDQQISAYVDRLDFINDAVFGVFNRRLHIIAMAHLAICKSPNGPPVGDFGVSVAPSLRGHGIGGRLYERAALHARNEGVEVLQIQALAENAAMLAIARKRGATVHRHGSESEGYLKLPRPDLESRLRELAGEYWAGLHYSLVAQSRIWVEMLKGFQSVRSRAIAATKICSP